MPLQVFVTCLSKDSLHLEIFRFVIDGKPAKFPTEHPPTFHFGESQVLSNRETDICYHQPWYEKGYVTRPLLDDVAFKALQKTITDLVANIIADELGKSTENFELGRYHTHVRSDEDHYRVIRKTRDLYLKDLSIDLMTQFEALLGFSVTDIDPQTHESIYVIVRINRPQSGDFNPPHKDIYHFADGDVPYLPKFVNIWIPICGVNHLSSLPVAEGSHLIPESNILRTHEKGVIGKNTYNVRMIKEWNHSNELSRVAIKEGEALFFTPHLIHGLAVNEQQDTTRVSLEFRLFKKSR